MTQQALIYQIFYNDRTRVELDPGFMRLDNMANLRPDWSEYWPIREFLLSRRLRRDTLYGFFSPKFGVKTGLDSSAVYQFMAEEEADVFLFSPFFDQSAVPLNIFVQARLQHPDAPRLFARVLGMLAPGVDPLRLVMDSRQVVFCNYFVARAAFWQRWIELCEPIPHDGGTHPAKVFLIERVASFILATESRWKVRAYDPALLPLSGSAPARFSEVFRQLDTLKQAWRAEQDPRHLHEFQALRLSLVSQIAASPRHHPQDFRSD